MSESWIDPGSLDGDALTQWYRRSPADIERARQEAAAGRYQDFFYGGAESTLDQQSGHEVPASSQDIGPDFGAPAPIASVDSGLAAPTLTQSSDPGITWVADGPNRLRSVKTAADGQPIDSGRPATNFDDRTSPTDGGLRSNVSYRPPMNSPPLNSGLQVGAVQPNQRVAIDPSKTPAFQTGSDGKLHPVPGWHTTGPFDFGTWSHNIHWGGVAKDLGEIVAGIPAFFSGVGAGADLLSALGPEAETAVAEGIAESPAAKAAAQAFHDHHPEPMYMGGAPDQERVRILDQLHRRFHSVLGRAHREAGFPPVGGRSGSAVEWAKHYEMNPGSRDEAFEILRRVSREFDELYGTNISSKLPRAPGSTEVAPPHRISWAA